MARKKIGSLMVLVIGVLLATDVGAQPRPVSANDARELSEQARRAYNLGSWQESIDGFARAYLLTGDAALLFNLGQAHRQAGHTADALRFYRSYLREKPDGANRQVAEEQIEELKNRPAASQPAEPAPTQISAPQPAIGAPSTATTPPPPPTAPGAPPMVNPYRVSPLPDESAHAEPTLIARSSQEPVPTSRKPPLPGWLPWAAAGTTVALVAGALLLSHSANTNFDGLKNSCGTAPGGCSSSQIDGVKSRDHAATALSILGGATAVTSGVSFFVNGRF